MSALFPKHPDPIPYSVEPITVADLIAHLQTLDQTLPVAYQCCSENVLLELNDLDIQKLCYPRPDGWVANNRPDKELREYLVFPGN